MDKIDLNRKLFIVGVGASAGGLEALDDFFSHAPVDGGVAYVVVQHLSPDYKSLMVELLSKKTKLPVSQVTDGIAVEPNHIYLIPPNQNMTIRDKKLHLTQRNKTELRLHLPIDLFLRSLASALGEESIAVILSGTGSDGTSGVRAIKEAGGMVIAQDETARFDSMPRSAIGTQLVDIILPPSQMANAIINYVQHPGLAIGESSAIGNEEGAEGGHHVDTLNKIFGLIYDQTNVDFTLYKPSTMIRRIERRMSVNQITDLPNYLAYMRQSSAEVQTLFKELLIGVTKFLRDREAYEELKTQIIPEILKEKTIKDSVRVWVAGCSTGEEAYSLAFLFLNQMEENGQRLNIKIFATDIDREALDTASRGIYPQNIATDIDDAYLQKYFVKKGDTFEIIPSLREIVIFAQQNIVKDPPFSKTDLITCRNVLIYFQTSLQKKAIDNFQFALLPGGYLFLGSSETIASNPNFEVFSNKSKIFRKTQERVIAPLRNGELTPFEPTRPSPTYWKPKNNPTVRRSEHLFKQLVEQMLPPCLVVDEELELMHAFGAIQPFLQTPTGYNISLNLMDMIHPDLSIAVGTAIHKAFKEKEEIVYTNLVVKNDTGKKDRIKIFTRPLKSFSGEVDRVLLVFEDQSVFGEVESTPRQNFDLNESASQRIIDLEQELQYTRESLQATIEELETANEELQATNEELLAANEELQSTNEELQSVNEELITVNSEFQAKIEELVELNDDLDNTFNITNAGTVFLDEYLNVRRFTPSIQATFNLIIQDISRPFSHISHSLKAVEPLEVVEMVLDTLIPDEREVQNEEGHWFLMRTVPYRTSKNAIRGVVLTLVNISHVKKTQQRLLEREQMVQTLSEKNLELSDQLKPLEILLVEDDLVLMRLLKKHHFAELNIRYNLNAVSSAELALDFLSQRKNEDESPLPDLIITDFHLPDMQGDELVVHIRENNDLKECPIIVMTGQNPQKSIPEIVNLPVNAFLAKPFDPIDLRKAVRSVFQSYDFVIVKRDN